MAESISIFGGRLKGTGQPVLEISLETLETITPQNLGSLFIEIKNNKARHKIQIVNTARWP